MRKSFILASLAVAALAGGATGVANAADVEPGVTPTTVPGIPDLETVMSVLTPDQLLCIAQSMGSGDVASDPVAAMTALTECGVSMEQLMQIATGETPASVVGATTLPAGSTPDAATITAVLGLLGIDDADLACLSGALAVPPADDNAALAVMTGCQISLTELLQSIVSVGTGGTAAPTVASVTTVAGTAAATGNPIADLLIQQFSAMGMTLTNEQATCIADQITSGSIDPATIGQDMTALTELLTSCGIELTDLMGG
jgi:hypothetical protein